MMTKNAPGRLHHSVSQRSTEVYVNRSGVNSSVFLMELAPTLKYEPFQRTVPIGRK